MKNFRNLFAALFLAGFFLASCGSNVKDAQAAAVENDIESDFTRVHFAFNKAVLDKSSKEALDLVALTMLEASEKRASMRYIVSGFADAVGSDLANLTISKKRSEAIVAYLVEKGVPSSKLETKFYGKSKLLVDTKKRDEQNRRGEITVMLGETPVTDLSDEYMALEKKKAEEAEARKAKAAAKKAKSKKKA